MAHSRMTFCFDNLWYRLWGEPLPSPCKPQGPSQNPGSFLQLARRIVLEIWHKKLQTNKPGMDIRSNESPPGILALENSNSFCGTETSLKCLAPILIALVGMQKQRIHPVLSAAIPRPCSMPFHSPVLLVSN